MSQGKTGIEVHGLLAFRDRLIVPAGSRENESNVRVDGEQQRIQLSRASDFEERFVVAPVHISDSAYQWCALA